MLLRFKTAAAMLAALMLTSSALAAAEPADNLIYADSFDFGISGIESMDGSYKAGGFDIVKDNGNNVLRLRGGMNKSNNYRYNCALIGGDISSSDYTIEFRAKANRLISDSYCILFGYADSANYYSVTWTQKKVPVYWESINDHELMICKNSLSSSVSKAVLDIDCYNWVNYKIAVKGSKIEIYMGDGGFPVLTYDNTQPIPAGKFGFGVYSSDYPSVEAFFDDVKIYDNKLKDTKTLKNRLPGDIAFMVNSAQYLKQGELCDIDGNSVITPVIANGTTMIPVRCIAEGLSCNVGFDAENNRVIVTNGTKEIKFSLGESEYYIDGEAYTSGVPIFEEKGRTMVPLRIAAEFFGKDVVWRDNGLIIITDKGKTFSEETINKLCLQFGYPDGNK